MADSGNLRIVKFNSAGVQQLIITATMTNPPLAYPWTMVVDGNGNIYISDTSAGYPAVIKTDSNGNQLARWNNTNPPLVYPNQLALDAAGNLYIADSGSACIIQLNPSWHPDVRVQHQLARPQLPQRAWPSTRPATCGRPTR